MLKIVHISVFFIFAQCFLFSQEQSYTCSMHPQIVQNKVGICPICFMDLISYKPDHREKETSKNTEFYTCSMHPQIHLLNFGTCPICGMSLVLYRPPKQPNFPPKVLAIINNSWKLNSLGQKELKIPPQEYVYNLVLIGAAADGFIQQLDATSALLKLYKDKKFSVLVKRLFNEKKYRLMDAATYFIVEKKRYDLVPVVEKFLSQNDVLVCKNFVDPHIGAAWCLANSGNKKQAIAILQQHLNKEIFYTNLWYILATLLYMNTPAADQVLLKYLNDKKTDKKTSDYYKILLKGRNGEESALKQIIVYAQNGSSFAQNFLKEYHPKKALAVFEILFSTYQNKEYLPAEHWMLAIDSAAHLTNNNNPKAFAWLQKQLKHKRDTSSFLFADLSHPQLQKTLYQLLAGNKNDFYIACVLVKNMSKPPQKKK